jgi:hypothetical protein
MNTNIQTLSIDDLSTVTGGERNDFPVNRNHQTPDNKNGGITGGIKGVPNNQVPDPPIDFWSRAQDFFHRVFSFGTSK